MAQISHSAADINFILARLVRRASDMAASGASRGPPGVDRIWPSARPSARQTVVLIQEDDKLLENHGTNSDENREAFQELFESQQPRGSQP